MNGGGACCEWIWRQWTDYFRELHRNSSKTSRSLAEFSWLGFVYELVGAVSSDNGGQELIKLLSAFLPYDCCGKALYMSFTCWMTGCAFHTLTLLTSQFTDLYSLPSISFQFAWLLVVHLDECFLSTWHVCLCARCLRPLQASMCKAVYSGYLLERDRSPSD